MRDVKRILKILAEIARIWKEVQDMRFGQLLINIGLASDANNLWHLEDDTLLERLQKFRWEKLNQNKKEERVRYRFNLDRMLELRRKRKRERRGEL